MGQTNRCKKKSRQYRSKRGEANTEAKDHNTTQKQMSNTQHRSTRGADKQEQKSSRQHRCKKQGGWGSLQGKEQERLKGAKEGERRGAMFWSCRDLNSLGIFLHQLYSAQSLDGLDARLHKRGTLGIESEFVHKSLHRTDVHPISWYECGLVSRHLLNCGLACNRQMGKLACWLHDYHDPIFDHAWVHCYCC